MPTIDTQAHETAKSFIDELARENPFWSASPKSWLFRGQADANWDLLPLSHREDTPRISYRTPNPESDPAEFRHRQLEIHSLWSFVEVASEVGLAMPPTDVAYLRRFANERVFSIETARTDLSKEESDFIAEWPAPEILDLLALARHHGAVTRLLDWSYDPLVAAFFAATDALLLKERADREMLRHGLPERPRPPFAVWALDRREVEQLHESIGDDHEVPARLEVLHGTAIGNPNLKAQRGLFTLVRGPFWSSKPQSPRRFLEELDQAISARRGPAPPVLRSITLPVSEAPELLALLEHRFVGAAQVLPGFSGVVRHLELLRFMPGS